MWVILFLFVTWASYFGVIVNSSVVADMDFRHEESTEDGQLSDEERKVTFLSSDADEEPSLLYPLDNIKESRLRSTEDEWCPPLPEALPASLTLMLCEAKKCQTDEDCATTNTESKHPTICCFNGCVHTCVLKVDPPIAFDWLEETDMRFLRNETQNGIHHHDSSSSEEIDAGVGIHRKVLLQAQAESESVTLPGGCLINLQQYEHLIQFRKNQHVSSCICSRGDVVCEVNRVPLQS